MSSGDAKSWQPRNTPWNSLVWGSAEAVRVCKAVFVCSPRALSSQWLQRGAGVAPVTGMLVWKAALFGKDRPGGHRGSGGNTGNVPKSVWGWMMSEWRLRALLMGQSGEGDLLWVFATGHLSTGG